MGSIEIVPAILRRSPERIEEDWRRIYQSSLHVQIDVTDGVFAGDGTFRELRWFKRLPDSEKVELHLMVHNPGYYVDDIIDLAPARCVFHVEAFGGEDEVGSVYGELRKRTQTELGLALNPRSPNERLGEYVPLLDYVMFLGVTPGHGSQPLEEVVFRKVGAFVDQYPDVPVAVDGHVTKETIGAFVQAGARILCANSAIFKAGDPLENVAQLRLLAEAAVEEKEPRTNY